MCWFSYGVKLLTCEFMALHCVYQACTLSLKRLLSTSYTQPLFEALIYS